MSKYSELRKLAEAATPGEWKFSFGPHWISVRNERGGIARLEGSGGTRDDMRFIAGANPRVVLQLLDDLEAARVLLRQVIDIGNGCYGSNCEFCPRDCYVKRIRDFLGGE